MRFNIGCVLLWALHNLTPGAAWAAASASKAASAPVVTSNCTRNADCTNGICSSDGLCGLQNGQACVASSQCRTVCAADGRCGVAAAHFCTSNASCRSNACNADNACGYLMGAKCDEADACRSGVCQNTTCVANCAADTDCQTSVTYCDNANTQLCTELLANAQPCTRDTMCQAGVCGSDGLCGAINTQSCTSADACRSGACQNGACSATCASDANCKTGTFCDAATQTCTQTLSAAQACGRDAQCDGGVCAADGLCGALSGGNCTTPKTCRSFVCAADFVCRDSCSADADCDHTHYCSSAVCVPRTGNGQACTLDTQCLAGLCNVLGTCGQLNGGACARGDDCVGGACSPNDLRCGLLFNAACANLDACRVGYCNTAGVCAPCSDNADCPMGACNKATGSCNTDPNYAGVGLEGGGCAQVGRTGLGALLGALTLWMGLRGRRKRGCQALWALWLVLGVGLPAHAAGFALQRFVPTDPGQMQLRVDKPWYAQERTRLDVGLVLDVGHNPLVYKTLFQNAPSLSTGIVTAQFNAVLQAAVSWTSWLTLSAHLPFVLVETGQQAYGEGPKSPAVGTVQANATFRLLGQADTSLISLHAALGVRIPEGAGSHAHDSTIGVIPRLIIVGRPVNNFSYALNAGVWIRPVTQLVTDTTLRAGNQVGSELQLGLALSYIDDHLHFSVGPEFNFGTLLSRGPGGAAANSSLEMLLGGVQHFTPSWSGGLAAGIGLFGLSGTPDWRIMARVSFSPFGNLFVSQAANLQDRDHDGIADEDDACPDTFGEPSNDSRVHGCPADKDGDGVLDVDDQCPSVAAGLHPDKNRPGCPMPEHTARQNADAEDADGSKADDMAQDVGEKPVAAAPSYEQKAGGGDDDFAPSLKPSSQSPNPDAAAATGPAAAHIPNAQSDMPATSESAPNAADPDAPPEQAPFGGTEPQSGAATSEFSQAPTHSVAHPPAAVAPVVLRNHVLSLQTPITFVGRTGKLSGPGRKAVQILASYLLAHKELKHIDIEVSTDNHGHARANKALAQKRANAIKQALIEHHVPAKSIRAHGLGDAHPIASNKTAAGRAKNMRVDLSAR